MQAMTPKEVAKRIIEERKFSSQNKERYRKELLRMEGKTHDYRD